MKIYLNSYRDDKSEHCGYEYFATKREAEKAATDLRSPLTVRWTVKTKTIKVSVTKKGMLAALNKYGNHPDNG